MAGYDAGSAWAAGDYGAFAVPSEGATTLGGLGGFGGLGSASGAWGAGNYAAFAVPEAGATTLGGLGTGGGAGAGGAGGAGAMGALGGLGALAAFAYLGYQEGSRQGRKNDAEAPGEYAAWKAANPNHPLLLQTDAERDDYYKSIYGG